MQLAKEKASQEDVARELAAAGKAWREENAALLGVAIGPSAAATATTTAAQLRWSNKTKRASGFPTVVDRPPLWWSGQPR